MLCRAHLKQLSFLWWLLNCCQLVYDMRCLVHLKQLSLLCWRLHRHQLIWYLSVNTDNLVVFVLEFHFDQPILKFCGFLVA